MSKYTLDVIFEFQQRQAEAEAEARLNEQIAEFEARHINPYAPIH